MVAYDQSDIEGGDALLDRLHGRRAYLGSLRGQVHRPPRNLPSIQGHPDP